MKRAYNFQSSASVHPVLVDYAHAVEAAEVLRLVRRLACLRIMRETNLPPLAVEKVMVFLFLTFKSLTVAEKVRLGG